MAMVKIGIMGGTFDPIHNGHIAIAREVREKLGLAYIIFVPAGQPWLKSDLPLSPADKRLEMVRLAIRDYSCFRLSSVEVDRQGPSYTVDTLEELQSELGETARLIFLLGWDVVAQLPRWHEVSRLLELCEIVAISRPGYDKPDLESLDKEVPGISDHIVLFDSPQIDISATRIRELIKLREPISGLVPRVVEQYIIEKGLYLEK